MIGQFCGDFAIKLLHRGEHKVSHQVIKATVVLDEMRRVKMVPEPHRGADRAVRGEQTTNKKGKIVLMEKDVEMVWSLDT